MLLIAKAALGFCGVLAMATAYTFHKGVIRIDVDENVSGGSHVHFWLPATVVSTGMHLAPRHNLHQVSAQVRQYLPIMRQLSKELPKYPNVVFVDVNGETEHVRVVTEHGKLCIDATEPDKVVHVTIPLQTIRDVADNLEAASPGV
jgi:hypothetical protein